MKIFALSAVMMAPAGAHLSYSGRDFGSFSVNDTVQSSTLSTIVSSNFGWADGTDLDYGDSHRLRAFRFTLAEPAFVTVFVERVGATAFLPAFSIYDGLSHLPPTLLAHDSSALSILLNPGKEGAFNALGDWTIGNDPVLDPMDSSIVLTPASARNFDYMGHFADGSDANYGTASGIFGDGNADGMVEGTIFLDAGDYTLMVGGADYASQGPSPYTSYAANVTIEVIPEPSSAMFCGLTLMVLFRRLRI